MPIPTSTYRLQLHRDFPVQSVIDLAPYLHDLGIGAVYLSPILQARPGSRHHYDVVNPDVLDPELGTPEQFREMGRTLRQLGMGVVVDIVPNHTCISDVHNSRWMDVLENGPGSPYATFFDIDWHPPRVHLHNKVLVPVLGDQYGRVLENAELRVTYTENAFRLHYADKIFPIATETWQRILRPTCDNLRLNVGEDDIAVMELESILTALSNLPSRTETADTSVRERAREKEVIKLRLARLLESSQACRDLLTDQLDHLNGRPGDPESFNELELLLGDQAYRLSFWRVAADEINYRRFFDVDELASIRIEDPAVFSTVHARILEGIRDGWITGLRVDHPDGLYDPTAYFNELQRAAQEAASTGSFYVVAEKIMGREERPRLDWNVHGTTGYEFLNEVNGLFVEPQAKDAIYATYERFTGQLLPFTDLVYESKRLILRVSLASELNVLSQRLDRVFQQHRHTRDFTLQSLRFALAEVIACFPVYRTYISETQTTVDDEDRKQVQFAIRDAQRRNPATNTSLFSAIAAVLLLEDPPGLSDEQRAERRLFVMRLQQLTGPVMAKGVEDTAFYRQFPLASLNEVGGDPKNFGVGIHEFHAKTLQRSRLMPHTMLATSTHDTKRSEDLRARIDVLTEIPEEWAAALERWSAQNCRRKRVVDGSPAPDREAEYLLYQTLVGAWPLCGLHDQAQRENFVSRMQGYMEKALHEAKKRTSWVNPNAEYDEAVREFIASILEASPANAFFADIDAFCQTIRRAGLWNALSQTVLKMTCPGVPDIYQGTELWNFALVDPDNRRSVDYSSRKHLLAELPGGQAAPEWIRGAVDTLEDGRLKLFAIARLARLRRDDAEFFAQSEYLALETAGLRSNHIVTFARTINGKAIITAVARFFVELGCRERTPAGEESWRDTYLNVPENLHGRYSDVFTGRPIQVAGDVSAAELFSLLPVSVLIANP